jgi:hypothetical protein
MNDHDTVTLSRIRHEFTLFLAITGWGVAFFVIGILIGRTQ